MGDACLVLEKVFGEEEVRTVVAVVVIVVKLKVIIIRVVKSFDGLEIVEGNEKRVKRITP
jgi:hypothetical protein